MPWWHVIFFMCTLREVCFEYVPDFLLKVILINTTWPIFWYSTGNITFSRKYQTSNWFALYDTQEITVLENIMTFLQENQKFLILWMWPVHIFYNGAAVLNVVTSGMRLNIVLISPRRWKVFTKNPWSSRILVLPHLYFLAYSGLKCFILYSTRISNTKSTWLRTKENRKRL